MHLLASYPADGQGTAAAPDADVACDSPTPDCPVPTNLVIELRFDRFLLPGGGLGSGVALYSGNPPANGIGLRAEYDLLERVVLLRPTRLLQPHTLYTAEVVPGANPGQGFWAFDRAPIEEGRVPLTFSFTTGSGPVATPAPLSTVPDTCETMTQGPFGTCASCHATAPKDATFPPMGLDLSSSRGLYYTAIGQVAHESETGDSVAFEGLKTPSRFGVQMNLIDPGSPATSYLIYKLLQNPQNFGLEPGEAGCVTGYHAQVAEGGCSPPDADEIVRMREWFLRGDPMPKDRRAPDGTVTPASTTRSNLARIAAWISAGATCAEPAAPDSP